MQRTNLHSVSGSQSWQRVPQNPPAAHGQAVSNATMANTASCSPNSLREVSKWTHKAQEAKPSHSAGSDRRHLIADVTSSASPSGKSSVLRPDAKPFHPQGYTSAVQNPAQSRPEDSSPVNLGTSVQQVKGELNRESRCICPIIWKGKLRTATSS